MPFPEDPTEARGVVNERTVRETELISKSDSESTIASDVFVSDNPSRGASRRGSTVFPEAVQRVEQNDKPYFKKTSNKRRECNANFLPVFLLHRRFRTDRFFFPDSKWVVSFSNNACSVLHDDVE